MPKHSLVATMLPITVGNSGEYKPPEAKNIVGGAGKEIWTFKALKKGATEVSMQYGRPWEGGEKEEWTFTVTVTVK